MEFGGRDMNIYIFEGESVGPGCVCVGSIIDGIPVDAASLLAFLLIRY